MDYQMLVLDLDGTTLDAQGQLQPIDIAAAHALTQHGVHVTIATGRLFTGTQWVARALGVKGGVAVMNGNEIIDPDTEVVEHGRYLDPEVREQARGLFVEHDLRSAFLFGSRRIHLAHHDAHQRSYLSTWTSEMSLHENVFAAPAWAQADDIVAVAVVGDTKAVSDVRERVRTELGEVVKTVMFRTLHGDTFLKLRPRGDDKGTALDQMAAARGTVAERTVAVGDWLNDLPMLRRAGLAFAMRHAEPQVVDTAHETLRTERSAGGAVAEIAQRVWGITP